MDALALVLIFSLYAASEADPNLPREPLQDAVSSSVKVVDGLPRLLLNGKNVVPFYGMQLYPDQAPYGVAEDIWKDHIDHAARYGYLYINPWLFWPIMDDHDEGLPDDAANWIDWAPLDAFYDYAAQKGVFVIPYFWLAYPPAWWREAFAAADAQRSAAGDSPDINGFLMASFGAPTHEKYADQAIRGLVERYRDHPASLGWGLGFGSSCENNYPGGGLYGSGGWYDHSDFSKTTFRNWLRTTYSGDIEAFRDAWNSPSATFDAAAVPEPLSESSEGIRFVNMGGDARRPFNDWLRFRQEQKRAAIEHFAQLYKRLDPSRIVLTMPAVFPFWAGMSDENDAIWAAAASIDYDSMIQSPNLDGFVLQPPIGENVFSQMRWNFLQTMGAYALSRGKLFAPNYEDYEMNDRLWVLDAFMQMAAVTGAGFGLTEGAPGGAMRPWSPAERIHCSHAWYMTQALPDVIPRRPGFAIIDSPTLLSTDYVANGDLYSSYKGFDIAGVPDMMADAGLDYEVITSADIVADPSLLGQYKAVALVSLARVSEDLVQALVGYRDSGGGLLVAGRTAMFDEHGEPRPAFLQRLLGLSEPLAEHVVDAPVAWHFADKAETPLIAELAGKPGHSDSVYNLPRFDYEAAGYTVLAQLEMNPSIAVVGCRENVVFWFSKLGHGFGPFRGDPAGQEFVMQFMRNVFEYFGIGYDKIDGYFLQSTGGNYKSLLTNSGYHGKIGFDVTSFAESPGGDFLVYDCSHMKPLAVAPVDADGRVWTEIDLRADDPTLLRLLPLSTNPVFVAGEWTVLEKSSLNENASSLQLSLYAMLNTSPKIAVYIGDREIAAIRLDGEVLEAHDDQELGVALIPVPAHKSSADLNIDFAD